MCGKYESPSSKKKKNKKKKKAREFGKRRRTSVGEGGGLCDTVQCRSKQCYKFYI